MPLFRWLLSLLRASSKQQLAYGGADRAGAGVSPDEAERQVAIAIEWGRYGEVLAYDDAEETFYLESPAG